MTTVQETYDEASRIIRDGLNVCFDGAVDFSEVRITPRDGADEEQYLDVQVIYDGSPSDMDPGLLNSLYHTIEDELRAIGIQEVPVISYRVKAEDGYWSGAFAVPRNKDQH